MKTMTDKLADALRGIPNDSDMIEHNPDEGMRLFCCGGDIVQVMRGDDYVLHACGCWVTRAREALAEYDADGTMTEVDLSETEPQPSDGSAFIAAAESAHDADYYQLLDRPAERVDGGAWVYMRAFIPDADAGV